MACVYTLTVVIILGTLLKDRLQFVLSAVLYGGVFALDILFTYTGSGLKETFDLLANAMHGIVFIALFVSLLLFLFKARRVTSDHVKGGVAAYFLMGILWGLFYRSVYFFDPSAFVFSHAGNNNLFYFSYVTLATLGYGDIVPASRFTQMLATMEAMIGQVFLAVFIARLLGLYAEQGSKRST